MSVRGRPIKPDEVVGQKNLPAAVFDAFNTLIATHWDGKEAQFTQKEVVYLIVVQLRSEQDSRTRESPEIVEKRIEDNRWLDIEPSYEQAGWSITYDRPGYNESYQATFTFKRRRTRKR